MEKGALVLEGGSLRGVFTAGVLDVLMEQELWFEYVNGVSAGSMCGYSYISRQPGRTREIDETFCTDRNFMGFRNLLRSGDVFNFDYLFGEISDTAFPADRAAFEASPQIFEAVATDCRTGRAAYFRKGEMSTEKFELACRASSSIPTLSRIVEIDGVPYLDGGCACPVAYQRAAELGYEKIVAILTRPLGYRKKPQVSRSTTMAERRLYAKKYPEFYALLQESNRRYNALYTELERLEREGKLFVLRPAGPVLVSRLERSADKLEDLYQQGRSVCLSRLEELKAFLRS